MLSRYQASFWRAGCLAISLLAAPNSVLAQSQSLQDAELKIDSYVFTVQLPEGFTVELLSNDLKQPRILHFAGERLFAGSRSGNVYWSDPPYDDYKSLVKLPNYPHSVVFKDGRLFVAETNGISSALYNRDTQTLTADQFETMVSLPGGRGHNSRTLKEGPDGQLYVSLGIAGNCSDQYLDNSYPFKERRGGVFLIDESGNKPVLQPFASGLRNPVGMDWHPETQEMYLSNNGPDHSGYELPREYFSRVLKDSFHGMPWFQHVNGEFIEDDCVSSEAPVSKELAVAPAATFPARIAPMDLAFIPTDFSAQALAHDAIVALHGSWATDDGGSDGDPASRREPKLALVKFNEGKAGEVQDFMTGFQLPDGQRWARPMGVAIGPDGHIYFSSDAGIQGIYRIKYQP